MEAKIYYYIGILCLVASTFALPLNSDNINSPSSKEIKEDYKNNVEVKKYKSTFPRSINSPSKYEWSEDNYGWIDDFSKYYKEVEDEEVQKEEVEVEKAEEEEANEEEAEEEEEEEVDEEEYSNEDEDGKYSNIEKSVTIKWKIPRSVLLKTLNAYLSPVPRNDYPYVYQPYHFPITLNDFKAPYPGYGNY